MTNKVQALVSGSISGLSAFISWLVMIPPEQQTRLLGPLVELAPIEWRDGIGLFTRALATLSSIYAVFKASQSGPQSPPKNPPSE